jgi:hypothetical protein
MQHQLVMKQQRESFAKAAEESTKTFTQQTQQLQQQAQQKQKEHALTLSTALKQRDQRHNKAMVDALANKDSEMEQQRQSYRQHQAKLQTETQKGDTTNCTDIPMT